jgi:hypothetical protein
MLSDRKEPPMATAETELIELSRGDYEAFLARELKAGVGLDLATFLKRYADGKLDEADPEVARLAALLGVGQNGHRSARGCP